MLASISDYATGVFWLVLILIAWGQIMAKKAMKSATPNQVTGIVGLILKSLTRR